MMRIKTLIVDDEPIALEKLKNYVERIPALELVGLCRDGVEAIAFLTHNPVDLLVTDINMPDLNGMELVKSLARQPLVIFTTAYSDFAVDGYKVSAVDYLLKPYGFADFSNAVNKAMERLRPAGSVPDNPADGALFVKIDHRFIKVNLSDIVYIKGYGEYLQIYVDGRQSPLVTLSSFAAIKDKLAACFLQVHRSYIVNMNRVDVVDRNRIIMDGNAEIPVGDSYKADLQQYLASNSIVKLSK